VPKETSSPFTPGIPVPVEFFVGRMTEIERLRAKLTNATSGRIDVAFLLGERGIGKSSLASFARVLAERQHQALGVHAFLGGVVSLEDMVQSVFDCLLKVSVGTSWFDDIKQLFGKHMRSVDLFGVNIEPYNPDLCVAAGAALRAAELPGRWSGRHARRLLGCLPDAVHALDADRGLPLAEISIGRLLGQLLQVTETDAEFLTVDVPGLAEGDIVRVALDQAINGTALRDATGTVAFADFQNQTDYQQFANELKALVRQQVTGELDAASLQAESVSVAGVYLTSTGPEGSYLVTPVTIEAVN
jgi:hypothetical protein